MSYGIQTYYSTGTTSFEISDRLCQIVFSYTPTVGSSGSISMPNVTSINGMVPINIRVDAVTNGGQGFLLTLTNPNVLSWEARPYGGLVKQSNAKILVVSSNV